MDFIFYYLSFDAIFIKKKNIYIYIYILKKNYDRQLLFPTKGF